jgi:hypothetical protein
MADANVGKRALWAGRIVSAIPVLMMLLSGYLGGAVATHVRVSDAWFLAPAILGALAWLGLFLRDPRLRALQPLRRDP